MSEQPETSEAPPPYQVVPPEQQRRREAQGKRSIGFGVAWLLGGLLLTLITLGNASGPAGGVYIVAWGPMLYGGYRIFRGYTLLKRSQE